MDLSILIEIKYRAYRISLDVRSLRLKRWHFAMLQNYSQRRLKFPKDKLPGVSGLASEFAAAFKTRYLAGLWEEDILMGLCWYPAASLDLYPVRVRGKIKDYVAPSWSWASQDTCVYCYLADPVSVSRREPEKIIWHAELVSSSMEYVAGKYGQVTAGSLKMRGKLLGPIVLEWDENGQVKAINGNYELSQFSPDDEINCGGATVALLLAIHEHLGSIFLFLEETGNEMGIYKRIGCWYSTSHKRMYELWAGVQSEEFTLI
jgi:hypothetical protein